MKFKAGDLVEWSPIAKSSSWFKRLHKNEQESIIKIKKSNSLFEYSIAYHNCWERTHHSDHSFSEFFFNRLSIQAVAKMKMNHEI